MKYLFSLILSVVLFADKPELLLLDKYSDDKNVTGWYMSEKLDGVRAYWDGKRLISRGGNEFATPEFFTKEFPKHRLDGELWSKREDFANIVSIVNQDKPHDGWKNITYNVFEVPDMDGNLTTRLSNVTEGRYLKLIPQIKVSNKEHLNQFAKEIEAKGGEGVVVRDATLPYYVGRTQDALKVKSYIDDECEIVGYNKGSGKYEGMVGSLSCRMKDMKIIKIGSGLSEAQRAVPPSVGTIITFKYYGLTSKGNPRFPIFLRERSER